MYKRLSTPKCDSKEIEDVWKIELIYKQRMPRLDWKDKSNWIKEIPTWDNGKLKNYGIIVGKDNGVSVLKISKKVVYEDWTKVLKQKTNDTYEVWDNKNHYFYYLYEDFGDKDVIGEEFSVRKSGYEVGAGSYVENRWNKSLEYYKLVRDKSIKRMPEELKEWIIKNKHE